mgnify:FL=1
MAWLLVFLTLIYLAVTLWADHGTTWGPILLLVLFLLSASSISLGNWVDRKTKLSLTPEGIQYRNGLRSVDLKWEDVQEVRVLESSFGQRVHVIGPAARFVFRTLGEVRVQGDLKGQLGFAQGTLILKEILATANLTKRVDSEKARYYSRP